MGNVDNSQTNRKASVIKLVLFGCVTSVLLLVIAAVVLFWPILSEVFLPAHWKVVVKQGLTEFSKDEQQGKQLIEKGLSEGASTNAPIFERMSAYRQYAQLLRRAGEVEEGDKQTEVAVHLSHGDPPPNSQEASELSHAYQDRGWQQHYRYEDDPTTSPGDKDQEMSAAVAEKAFGPDHEQTIYKLASLAVIYADMNQQEKADKVITRCLNAVDTKPSAKECGWFVYGMNARIKAVEHHYQAAAQSYLHAKSLGANDTQTSRVWEEFTQGLYHRRRPDAEGKEIDSLVTKEQFAELDQLGDKLRKAQTPLADGRWKLDRFYEEIRGKDGSGESEYAQRLFEIKKWLAANPQSVAARVGLADCYINYAWCARGGGYSDSVSERGWKLFGTRLAQAKSTLDSDPAIKRKCPRAFRDYSKIALGQSMEKKSYLRLLDDCHKTWRGYHYIDVGACFYFLPRWYGSEHETESYIKSRADAIPGAKGDELYAQLVWSAGDYLDYLFQKQSPIEWKRVKAGFKQIFADFPNDLEARIAFIRLAVEAGDEASISTAFEGYRP